MSSPLGKVPAKARVDVIHADGGSVTSFSVCRSTAYMRKVEVRLFDLGSVARYVETSGSSLTAPFQVGLRARSQHKLINSCHS